MKNYESRVARKKTQTNLRVASTLFKMSKAAAASSHSPRNKRENVCDQQQQASTAHGTNMRMSVDSEVERISGRSPQTQLGESRDTMGDRAACTVQVTPRVFSISLRIWAEPADTTQSVSPVHGCCVRLLPLPRHCKKKAAVCNGSPFCH